MPRSTGDTDADVRVLVGPHCPASTRGRGRARKGHDARVVLPGAVEVPGQGTIHRVLPALGFRLVLPVPAVDQHRVGRHLLKVESPAHQATPILSILVAVHPAAPTPKPLDRAPPHHRGGCKLVVVLELLVDVHRPKGPVVRTPVLSVLGVDGNLSTRHVQPGLCFQGIVENLESSWGQEIVCIEIDDVLTLCLSKSGVQGHRQQRLVWSLDYFYPIIVGQHL